MKISNWFLGTKEFFNKMSCKKKKKHCFCIYPFCNECVDHFQVFSNFRTFCFHTFIVSLQTGLHELILANIFIFFIGYYWLLLVIELYKDLSNCMEVKSFFSFFLSLYFYPWSSFIASNTTSSGDPDKKSCTSSCLKIYWNC